MKKIGIIGGGFCGIMSAIHLIQNSTSTFALFLINNNTEFGKGIAYNAYSNKLLLNVITSKMSAFPDEPDHFLKWVLEQGEYSNLERELLANSFLPRSMYGEYLTSIWEKAKLLAKTKGIEIHTIVDTVNNFNTIQEKCVIYLENEKAIEVDECILATGNLIPRNPEIENPTFFESKNYFQNPWDKNSVINTTNFLPILLIGNGLTMVDTVIGLLENGFKGTIYTISPNGFHILPHRHGNLKYQQLVEELEEGFSLRQIVKMVIKHTKRVRKFGISAEPIIDSLRGKSQKIWMQLSRDEKKQFLSKYRHFWGVARHRIPLQIHDKINQLKIDDRLKIKAGKIINLEEKEDIIKVTYFDKLKNETKKMLVSRVINCTGPESDIEKSNSTFLKNCLEKGIICQDEFKLGIEANPTSYQIINNDGKQAQNIYTIGSSLRGKLWESTAVNELRVQAFNLANQILKIHN
jgi:uncharacterized NAD(P)/FAD-binding protein YdhS